MQSRTSQKTDIKKFGKNPKPNLGTTRGLVEYILRQIGIAPSCIVSETAFEVSDDLAKKRQVTVTQIKWRQCAGHIYNKNQMHDAVSAELGKPDQLDPLFLDCVLLLFDTREDISYDHQMHEYFAQISLGKDALVLTDDQLQKVWHSRPKDTRSGISCYEMWYGWTLSQKRETYASKVHPQDLGCQIKKLVHSLNFSDYLKLNVTSRRLKSSKWEFSIHPRIISRKIRIQIRQKIYAKMAEIQNMEIDLYHMKTLTKNMSKNKWCK